MKSFLLVISFLIISGNCFSQDRIIRTNGKIIDCKVLSIDSNSVYISYMHGDQEIKSFVPADQIERIVYKGEFNPFTVSPDSIFITRESGRYAYYHKGLALKKSELKGLLSLNAQARQELKKVNGNNIMAGVLCVGGAALISVPIITKATNEFKKPNWYFAVAGGALILIAIPVALTTNPDLHKAIDYYNAGLNTTSMAKTELLLGFTENGIGIRLIF